MADKRINDNIKIDFEVPKLLRNTMEEAEKLDKTGNVEYTLKSRRIIHRSCCDLV